MSATMTMTLPPATMTTTAAAVLSTEKPCCPNCGVALPPSEPEPEPHAALLRAQRQIEDLQAQVRLLNQKASAAVDRWADYEDELSRLRAASTSTNATTATSAKQNASNNNRPHTPDPSVSTASPRSSFLGAGAASRISQLLSPRKSAPAAQPAPNNTHTTSAALHQVQRGSLSSVSSPALPLGSKDATDSPAATDIRELLAALTHERRLRTAAEEKLAATSREVEDLSASLFEQANNMVATERRARAALEERVSELGQRNQEKKVRLGRLESAILRIERVREVLAEKVEHEEKEREAGDEEDRKEEEGEEEDQEDEQRGHEHRQSKDTSVHTKEEG